MVRAHYTTHGETQTMKLNAAMIGLCIAALPGLCAAQAYQQLTGSMPDERPMQIQSEVAYDGLNDAATVCGSMSFDNRKAPCMSLVNSARFFDRNAVRICGGRSFDDGK